MDPSVVLPVSVAVGMAGMAGGIVFGYGKLNGRVESMNQKIQEHRTETTTALSHLNDAKADNAKVEGLHEDMREVRRMVTEMYRELGK